MVDIAGNTTTTATFEGSPAVLATYSGELESFDDKDWIRVTLTQNGVYRFYGSVESSGPRSGDSRIALFDAAGNFIDENDDRPTGTSNSMILFTAPTTGTYYLQIEAVDGLVANYSVFVTINLPETTLTETNNTSSGSGSNLVTGYFGDDFIDFTTNAAGIFAFGEQGNDTLIGNAGDNRLSGGLGNDNIAGFGGNDRLFGDAGLDSLDGGSDDDLLYGGPGGDVLHGGSGNDVIYTGAGDDQAYGDGGNDEFHVESAGDRVFEALGQGTDVVFTSVSYALRAGQEIEFVETENPLSTAPLNLAGNELANNLTGNNGANVLNGGEGMDVLSGLLGNDIYVLANGSDSVIDSGGIDTATSTITRSLLVGGLTAIENLTLTGATAASGIGNARANVITGNNAINTLDGGLGNDTLKGLGGNDVLVGGAGRDTMAGGLGNDLFRYAAASQSTPGAGADVITDFDRAGNDAIDLRGVFGGVLAYRHAAAFTGAGQVRINDIAGPDVVVEVNIGGSLAADMQIRLTATTLASMTASDFLL